MTNKASSGVSTPIGRREWASIASANLIAISMKVRPMSRPKTENRNSKSVIGHPRPPAVAGVGRVRKREKVEADDPARNRCGCFLPDLTRLATAPSADFRAGIWVEACPSRKFARRGFFIDASRAPETSRRRCARRPRYRFSPRPRMRSSRRRTADQCRRPCLGAVHQPDGRAVPARNAADDTLARLVSARPTAIMTSSSDAR